LPKIKDQLRTLITKKLKLTRPRLTTLKRLQVKRKKLQLQLQPHQPSLKNSFSKQTINI